MLTSQDIEKIFTKGVNLLPGELKKVLKLKLVTKQEEYIDNMEELSKKSLQNT